jgi:hypothetical protein
VSAQIRFLSNGVEKLKLLTDSSGYYSGNIPSCTYDIQATFPQSVLYLYDAIVNSFDDPIKHYYSSSSAGEGLNAAGLYVYEVLLSYSKASIEMRYNEGNALDEKSLRVYKCDDWNNAKNLCSGSWRLVEAVVDTGKNTAFVNTTILSAYAVGTLKQLSIDFNLNKEEFYLKDLVKLKGMVVDEVRNPVSNTSVSVYVQNTNINMETFSDNNGIFSLEFLSPETEGDYTLVLSAEKSPYLSFNSSTNLEIAKSKEISIIFPDTVKIGQGESSVQDFTLVNIGQSDLYNLNISLSGISNEYYTLQSNIEKLPVGEQKKLSIYFSIPVNVSLGTSSVNLKVSNSEVFKEKTFGFTILDKNQTTTTVVSTTGLFGKVDLTTLAKDLVYVTILVSISISAVLLLKKMKSRGKRGNEIKDLLFDIKNHIKRKESELSNKKISMQESLKQGTIELNELEKMIR